MLNEALNLASKGFRIIPCKEKIPQIKKWQINATNNSDKIKELWSKSDYNIGILTGADGGNIVVIDCDIKEDINGVDNFIKFIDEKKIILPNTLTATSGRGGKHYYFRSKSSNIKSGTNIFDKGIDIRANGGFIIAPPSLHPNGNRYSWDNSSTIVDLPKQLESVIIEYQNSTNLKKDTLNKTDKTSKKINNIKNYTELIDIEIGERNETLFRLSSKLIESGLCYKAILEAINIENNTKCVEPLTKEEIANIVNSSYKYKSNEKIRVLPQVMVEQQIIKRRNPLFKLNLKY